MQVEPAERKGSWEVTNKAMTSTGFYSCPSFAHLTPVWPALNTQRTRKATKGKGMGQEDIKQKGSTIDLQEIMKKRDTKESVLSKLDELPAPKRANGTWSQRDTEARRHGRPEGVSGDEGGG